MKSIIHFGALILVLNYISACAKSGSTNASDKLRPDQKPHVIDALKGKSKSEILAMKYKELKAVCSLKSEKVVREQVVSSTGEFTDLASDSSQPVTNPTVSWTVFDIKLQQKIDANLSQEAKAKMSTTIEGKDIKLGITFRPVLFAEALDISLNQKRYIMKHTPVLSYSATYELDNNGSLLQGNTESSIYEKIELQRNTFLRMKIGMDNYYFFLDCNLERAINDADRDLAAEFESQWTSIGK